MYADPTSNPPPLLGGREFVFDTPGSRKNSSKHFDQCNNGNVEANEKLKSKKISYLQLKYQFCRSADIRIL